jgi:rare lipoprotein A
MAHRKRTSVDDGMTLRGAGKSSARPRFTVSQSQAARLVTHARRKKPERVASNVKSSTSQIPTLGLASFYSQDQETASGESFDRRRLNAAHPSLPFGTRLRVTNVMNGKSVTVRINDRGPFVRGRIIDVTAAAAEALGMVNAGVAKVTLNIIR